MTVRVDRDIPFPAKHPPDDNTTTGVCSLWPIGARIRAASQFFICMNRENTQHLDGVHTCFGRVIEGVDVIDDIRPGDLILSIRIVEE